MRIRVEFFGIPRLRAGVAEHTVQVPDESTIASVYESLAKELPPFAAACLTGDALQPGYIASVNGNRFVQGTQETITEADTIQILSADVGG
ncbi:MoaD/ThiS family protein [Thalassoroseus pseudoceratinae]|uniref:MoaD/ThiS family protein n=1 Tax=Thalassoroseus pseudoceratinae TaxID=2713176 RepID=UPI00141F6FDC|nr:MoaD/ThiS family protein [Thalassoroseus pseudoceratinae]